MTYRSSHNISPIATTISVYQQRALPGYLWHCLLCCNQNYQSHDNCKDEINTLHLVACGGWGFRYSFCSVNQWEFVQQARQHPNLIRGPSCHMSSFRQQKMDVLHFTAHNICRDNHSSPQRACVAVLKLSIVLAVMSLAFSYQGQDSRGRFTSVLLVCMATVAV